MPCRVSSGVHERNNEVPTVPAWGPVNPQASEQSGLAQWEEKTPWSFTAVCSCGTVIGAERRRKLLILSSLGGRGGVHGTPPTSACIANLAERRGTRVDGQFGWGGTPLKRYRGRPKVGSLGSELRGRV